jgi:hypothetical protein
MDQTIRPPSYKHEFPFKVDLFEIRFLPGLFINEQLWSYIAYIPKFCTVYIQTVDHNFFYGLQGDLVQQRRAASIFKNWFWHQRDRNKTFIGEKIKN